MKKLLKILLILVIVLVVIVSIPLILLHKKTTPPIDQYTLASEETFYTAFDQELSDLITDDSDDTVELLVDESFINRIIQKNLAKDNDKYLNDDYDGEMAYNYMMTFGNNLGLKGLWVELSDDKLVVTGGVDFVVGASSVWYQSGVVIVFDIVLSEDEQYYLKVSELEIGRMSPSLNSAFNLADRIVKMLTAKSLNELIAENLKFGEFNQEDLSFTVGETQLVDYLYEVDPTFSALMKLVYKENLLILDVSDAGFDISLNIGVFRRLLTDLDEPAFDKWESDADKAVFMAGLAAQAASNFFLNPLDPYLDLDEEDLNAILDYQLQDKVSFEQPIKFTLNGIEYEYIFSSTNLFIRMDEDVLSIHLKMSLTKTGLAGSFDMQFNLTSNVSMNSEGDMVLTIIDSNIGEIDLDIEMLTTLFSIFDESLMVDNTIVIPKETLNKMFEGSSLVFEDSYVTDSVLRLHYGIES